MKRTKRGQKIKQPPFNINISFNINPKNVHQSQNHTSIKLPQNATQQISQKSNFKPNANKNSNSNPSNVNLPNLNILNRPISQYMPQETQQKKQLEQLKKNFLAKINNFDIVLPSTTTEQKNKNEDNIQKSSIMSERMQKFEVQQNITSDLKDPQHFNLNIQNFQPSKSKVLTNNAFTRGYNMDTKKKDKSLPNKHSLSQVQHQSKWLTHQKGQSCFTDRKYMQKSSKRKKSFKKDGKNENLKQKLQKFKVDLMKLALVYQETQVLKTKMSSEYHNVRSREISKENVMKMTEGQDAQHLLQMRQFQASKNEQSKQFQKKESDLLSKIKNQVNESLEQLISEAEESQSFSNFKNIYKGLQRQNGNRDENVCTYSIIDFYKNFSEEMIQEGGVLVHQNKQQNKREKSEKSDVSIHMQETLKQKQASSDKNERNKEMVDLGGFLQFASFKLGEEKGTQFKQIIQTLFSQYRKQDESPYRQLQATIKQKEVQIEEVDQSINKQLNIIPNLRSQLVSEFQMKPKDNDDLQFWEQSYKEELLRIKGRMWKQYYSIKNEVQSRINSGNQSKVIKTKKQEKMGKIMKCLSQKIINKAFSNNLKIESQIQKKQTYEGQSSLLKLKEVKVQQKLTDFRQKEQYLKVEMSQEEMSEEESFNLPISFHKYGPEASILIEQNSASREEIVPVMLHITEEDKQDIFQFIFLDLCIQLYQNYLEKVGKVEPGTQVSSAQKILNRINQYINEEKQRKKIQSTKQIGISTNINTVRTMVGQLISFLSQETFISTINSKLNAPLGPSQAQILKSLRLPVFDQYNAEEDIQQIEDDDLLVLEPNWFLRFQNEVIHIQEIQFCKYYDSPQRDLQRINYLKNCTHIHHKAIYDCLNQHLDYSRLYGLWGRPFTWKVKSLFDHKFDEKHTKLALKRAESEVVRCCMFACGLMVNKEQSLIKDIANDVQYVRRLQDERVYRLLQNFVSDMQQKWFFHDDEQAQILIQVSHIVWTILIKEVIKDITNIQKL